MYNLQNKKMLSRAAQNEEQKQQFSKWSAHGHQLEQELSKVQREELSEGLDLDDDEEYSGQSDKKEKEKDKEKEAKEKKVKFEAKSKVISIHKHHSNFWLNSNLTDAQIQEKRRDC